MHLTSKNDNILYLDASDVATTLQQLDLPSILSDVLALHARRRTALPDEAYLSWVNAAGEPVRSLNMPSFIDGEVRIAGTKIINGNIHNVEKGLARASGLTLLFEPDTGRVCAIMDASLISAYRTATVSVLSVQLFKGREIETFAIIGAGVLARAHLDVLPRYLPSLREIRIFDLSIQRSCKLLEEVRSDLGHSEVEISISKSAEHAIRGAGLIVPVTTTVDGYIAYDWLEAGAILVNVSLDDPLPEVFLKADRLFVDDWQLVRNDRRRILGRMYRDRLVSPPASSLDPSVPGARRVSGELGDVVNGTVIARERDDEVILVNPFGLSIEDVAVAARVYALATHKGMGQRLNR